VFTSERQRAILGLLEKKQRLGVLELQRRLKVSSATLRRDLAELEAAHKLVRVHGGAMHPAYFQGEPSLEQKGQHATLAKRAIGVLAASLVRDHQTVLIDSGTTCLEVARALLHRSSLTLVTNSIPVAAAAQNAAARVICVGGELRKLSGALIGPLAVEWLENLRADWAFVGASGLSASEGATTTETAEAQIKQLLLRRAERGVLVADSSKWEAPETVRFAAWSAFESVISDSELGDEASACVRSAGPEVRLARLGDST
jgi:DeoR family transcriptional regulator, fructose operon transcriptional repressor